jgi:D-alanyl-D-alanine carboxypeptidase/D-alanyl-D-alanine-endopeptidase (penicillin-binding protein 4)
MAETVLRTMGAQAFGLPGTTVKGTQAVSAYLNGLGIRPTEYHLVNGSGLSRDVVLRPSLLTAVLVDMAHDTKVGHEFQASLAIAGEDGTLRRRLTEEPGRLRGKTGTLDGVYNLVGYVTASDDKTYAFALLTNDVRGDSSPVRRLGDRFARLMFNVSAPSSAVSNNEGDEPSDD